MRISRFEFTQLHDFRQPLEALSFTEMVEEMQQEVVETPPTPTFSEAQLIAAIAQAKAEGFAEGLAQGHAEAANESMTRERDMLAIISKLENAWAAEQAFYERFINAQCRDLNQFVMAIARKVAGEALTARPEIAIQELLTHCVPVIINKPRITLEVHPSMVELLSEKLAPVMQRLGFEGEILFRGNDRVEKSDVQIEWPSGRAERNTAVIWEQIETMMRDVSFVHGAEAPSSTESLQGE